MKTLDITHHYRGYWNDGGVCRLRIYRTTPDVLPVVIATERPDNSNTSVTNMSERLAAEVLRDYLPDRTSVARRGEQPFVWIEHYPGDRSFPERFAIVTYATWTPYERSYGARLTRPSFGSPRWEHVGAAAIEALTGEPWSTEHADDYLVRR